MKRRGEKRKEEEGQECNVDSSPARVLTASCIYVTLRGPSQTWAFLSHTPIMAIIVLMIPFFCVALDAFIF